MMKRARHSNDIIQALTAHTTPDVGAYQLMRVLGEGTFGKVRLARYRPTSTLVAIKCVERLHAPVVIREIETWRHLRHAHIAELFEVIVTDSKIHMVMEYAEGGEVFEKLHSNGPFTEHEVSKIIGQIADALDYCHDKNFIHRDLKLENVLLDRLGNVKLIDFGFTRRYDKAKLLDTFCGSTAYAAPEMINAEKYIGPSVDIWSLGVMLYTLACGYLPFDDDIESEIHKKILNMEYTIPPHISHTCSELIQAILQRNPADRPTIKTIRQNRFFTTPQSALKISENSVTQPLRRIPPRSPQEFTSERSESTSSPILPSSPIADTTASYPNSPTSHTNSAEIMPEVAEKHCKCCLQADYGKENAILIDTLLTAGSLLGLDMEYCLKSYRQHAVNHSAALWYYYSCRTLNRVGDETESEKDSIMSRSPLAKVASGSHEAVSPYGSSRRLSLQESWQSGKGNRGKPGVIKSTTGPKPPPTAFPFAGHKIEATPKSKAHFTISEEDETGPSGLDTRSHDTLQTKNRRRSTSALVQSLPSRSTPELKFPPLGLVRSLSVITDDSQAFGTASEGGWSEDEKVESNWLGSRSAATSIMINDKSASASGSLTNTPHRSRQSSFGSLPRPAARPRANTSGGPRT